ncbi:MAG: hypothetical protein FWG05_04955 [Kiritimatiellaeota bacterium]|nr:hypothetical protein [Kiritimatiellota bacterium]
MSTALAQHIRAEIPDSEYVTVSRDGHLELRGERIRFWGWIGHFHLEGALRQYAPKPDDTPDARAAKYKKMCEVYDALAQRIADMGFNLVRYWNDVDYTAKWTPGDMSPSDEFGFMLAALEKRGIHVWSTSFNGVGSVGADDADIIDSPDDADAWRAAIDAQNGGRPINLRGIPQIGWDARTQAKFKAGMEAAADWRNPYQNNIRLGDNPQVAVWELSNEEWYFNHLTRGDWQSLPKFFRDSLAAHWNAFLLREYGDDDALRAAWGFLLEGESPARGSVLLAPLAEGSSARAVNDANPAALAALAPAKQSLRRDDFTRVRASDVVRFFSDLHIDYKTAMYDHAKTLGKSLRLSPLVLDTGDGFRMQTVRLYQSGDASAMCTYIWQTAWDRDHRRFPFISGLDEPPRMAMGIPWVEVARIPGKPFFVYEFQQNNPDKYRAEVPYRIAALGAAQDWDIINFHIFGRPSDPAEAEPYSKALNLSHAGGGGGSVEGVHFKNDEIYVSALKAASIIFRNGALGTIEKPTLMTFGRRSMFAPESADYGKSFGEFGHFIAATANRFGLQMRCDPTREDDAVEGMLADPLLQQANPLRPLPTVEYDWHKGHIKLDTPQAVAYAGFYAQHGGAVAFGNGVTLDAVKILNPPAMPYPMTDDEQYIGFALAAQDGLPLEDSRSVYLSLVSTSFNDGFALDHDRVAAGFPGHTGKPYIGMRHGGDTATPVLVARVGATLTAPQLRGMKWKAVDWHFRELAAGAVGGGAVGVETEIEQAEQAD